MKKLIIAAAVAAIGAAAGAATVNWQSGTIYVASDAAGTTGSGTDYRATVSDGARPVTAMLYAITSDDYSKYSKMSQADIYNALSSASATGTAAANFLGVATISQTVTDGVGDVYAVLIYKDTTNGNLPDGADAFVKVAVAKVNVGGSGSVNATNLIGNVSSWTPVPEPTGGLLLALGVAALALRRKRA